MSDFILFVLNKEAFYYICSRCKNPLLYIYDNDKIKINNDYKRKDPFLYKSLKICEKLFDITDENADDNFFEGSEYIQKKKGNEKKFVANPPKIEKFINLIYFNDNPYEEIKSEIDDFYNQTNGLFIFCNSINSFRDVINLIRADNKNNCKFCLISNGRSFRNAMEYIPNENQNAFIQKACIFCFNKEEYLGYLNEYDFLEGIYTTNEEVFKFIENNSFNETKIYKSLKIITYDKYKKKYNKMHQMIAKYYRMKPNDDNSFTKFYQRVKEEIKNNWNKGELERIFIKFNDITDHTNSTELIKDYTGKYFYPVINGWLKNLENWTFEKKVKDNFFMKIIKRIFRIKEKKDDNNLTYEKNAYFVGQLMYKLNYLIIEDKNINNNQIYNQQNLTLHRGMHMDFIESLIYPIQKGKIISFGTFTSTSKNKGTAEWFSTNEKKDDEYSILMEIKVPQNQNLFPMFFEIKESYYNGEKECLFPPLTFFRLTNFSFDYPNKKIKLDLEVIGKRSILELELTEKNSIIYDEKKNIMNLIIKKENGEYYIGDLSNGKKNGQGILYYQNNSIKFEGDFANDKYEGNGRYNWEDGKYYIGHWLNGKTNGPGILYYRNGNVKYNGNFVNGKYEGNERYNWEDGEYYEGQWVNDLRQGRGTEYYRNGNVKYDGNFVNGRKSGEGRYNWENGEYYIGQWLNGKRNGPGILYYRNGSVKYDGNFVNDKYEGHGIYNWEDGEYYEGQWVNGVRQGKGRDYYRNGSVKYDGNFVNDKYEGKGRYEWENGEYYIGQWLNGVRHGKGVQYDNNHNKICEGTFDNNHFIENDDCSIIF